MIAVEYDFNQAVTTAIKSGSKADMEKYLKFHKLLPRNKTFDDFKEKLCGRKMDYGYIPESGIWFDLDCDGRKLNDYTDISIYIDAGQ